MNNKLKEMVEYIDYLNHGIEYEHNSYLELIKAKYPELKKTNDYIIKLALDKKISHVVILSALIKALSDN